MRASLPSKYSSSQVSQDIVIITMKCKSSRAWTAVPHFASADLCQIAPLAAYLAEVGLQYVVLVDRLLSSRMAAMCWLAAQLLLVCRTCWCNVMVGGTRLVLQAFQNRHS